MSGFLAALPIVGDLLGGYLERRHERKMADIHRRREETKAKAEVRLEKERAKIAIEKERQSADIQWATKAQDNAGWRDDAITVWFLVLLTAHFIPGSGPYILEGWRNFNLMPEWMAVVMAIVLTAAFGVNAFKNYRTLVRGGKNDG